MATTGVWLLHCMKTFVEVRDVSGIRICDTVFYGIPDHDGIPDHFPRLCTGEEISANRTSKHILKAS